MRYIPSTKEQQEEMLKEIGVSSFEQLINNIPNSLKLKSKLNIPSALSEFELEENILEISQKNANFQKFKPLIGAGTYRHFIPEAQKALLQRQEFWTCYTPYQPELSQGTLQTIFEFQSYIARLTKMEVVVPSIFDGASAAAEAILMSLRLTHKNKIIVSKLIHPHYLKTIKTYLAPHNTIIVEIPFENGLTSLEHFKQSIDNDTACILIQSPNFFGGIENIKTFSEIAHQKDTLFIQIITESMSLGLLKSPGDMGADIVVGNTQSFGLELDFGGPHNAFLATRKKYIRQIPGRIAGETRDKDGKRCFVMTFRAREQDIRREKATSNICTNHNLNVVASNIYLSLMGTEGIRQYSLLNAKIAHYFEKKLLETGKFEKMCEYSYFNEFLITYKGNDINRLSKILIDNNFVPPLLVQKFYPDTSLQNTLLFAITEIFNRNELDSICNLLSQ
ncbi:MAG: aminomethyl-transferring glycine dehydrogenase subunit GcvPA [Candidatus Caldatribacteriota bacterium]|jgi:glycine dehydrogenase subunit 1|nr:aminomethyl-transferring glycine dehydrogenase subunit GcvPA [Atribacterota bacterium]MDD3031391.1 aminomethyl-transferring glycine dehydrogenase subunit GcvPA [Atribacterota bacterium]